MARASTGTGTAKARTKKAAEPAGPVGPGPVWRTETYRLLTTRLSAIVGGKTATPFEALKVRTVGDLMHHLPRRYFSGAELSDLSTLRPGEDVAVMAEVRDVRTHNLDADPRFRGGAKKPRLEAVITDHRGTLTLSFFGTAHLVRYWSMQLAVGRRGIFAGRVNEFNNRLQLAHPDFVILDDDGKIVAGAARNADLATVTHSAYIGLYPATGKLRTWTIAQSAGLVLDYLGDLTDPLPAWLRDAAEVVELDRALRGLHQPQTEIEIEQGRDRLKFDEAFALQLTMARRRADAASHAAVARPRRTGGLLDAFDARLPFTLTQGQVEVSDEIMAELALPQPMQRLLQGEVGSGKTLVALRAMLTVIESGGQAALLAPTEVLAGQHLHTITRLLGDLAQGNVLGAPDHATEVVLITGSLNAAQRREALLKAASGEAGIVIGTHALLSAGVQFAELGLVVVDEQHRFGVEQRSALNAKAEHRPHVLVMTATPIPRSVAMTVFGDLATSTLTEIPAGRADVSTVVVDTRRNPAWVDRAWRRVVEEVAEGRQAYVVCARISSDGGAGVAEAGFEVIVDDEAELPPATAVTDLYAELTAGPLAGLRVATLHGQMAGDEKDAVMQRFAAGEIDVLVATTVVEVGVDVANASVMVICDADRFGISQLHQLRGRIGRGSLPGVCLLLTASPDGTLARERLSAVAATRDGFSLAETDLAQRREGDVIGASQSGARSGLRLLRVLDDTDLIVRARDLAIQTLERDPDLSDPGLSDTVTFMEARAAGDWLERT